MAATAMALRVVVALICSGAAALYTAEAVVGVVPLVCLLYTSRCV